MFCTVLMERPDTFNVCVRLHMDLFSNLSFFYTTILVTLRYRQTQVQDLINQHANPTSPMNILRLIKARVTLPLTHIFHKIENNLAILQGVFLILGRNVYHYHLSRTELWQRNMILSTAKNS